jgi:hypothetical protein
MSAAPYSVSRGDAEKAEFAKDKHYISAAFASSAPLRETDNAPKGAGWLR